MEIINNLVKIAQDLDSRGETSLADLIDKISSSVLQIKTAQYVGVQGYWIRNKRCFSNCYRQKRAKNEGMPAQEVWSECHKEYIASINNDGSLWDKYADSDSLIKISSIPQKEINEFISLMDEKFKNTKNMGIAINASLKEKEDVEIDRIITISQKILDVADKLEKYPEISTKLAESANTLIKEAGIFDTIRGMGDSIGQYGSQFMSTTNVNSIANQMASMEKQIAKLQVAYDDAINKSLEYFTEKQNASKVRTQTDWNLINNSIKILNYAKQKFSQQFQVTNILSKNVRSAIQGHTVHNKNAPQQGVPGSPQVSPQSQQSPNPYYNGSNINNLAPNVSGPSGRIK